jgi:DNA-binding transcriptional LysR family regulator
MARDNISDLSTLLAVVRERNFTRAAAQLGMSQPAISQTIRELEARLGIRLLTRTTRSVAPTELAKVCCGRSAPTLTAELARLQFGIASWAQ